jgi:hypothetical protein
VFLWTMQVFVQVRCRHKHLQRCLPLPQCEIDCLNGQNAGWRSRGLLYEGSFELLANLNASAAPHDVCPYVACDGYLMAGPCIGDELSRSDVTVMQQPLPKVWFSGRTPRSSAMFGAGERLNPCNMSTGAEPLRHAIKHAWTAFELSCLFLKCLLGLMRNLRTTDKSSVIPRA